MATPKQIGLIHVLVQKLGITDEDYRDMLAVYNVDSSKDSRFTVAQAKELIEHLVPKAEAFGLYQAKKTPDSSPDVASRAQKAMLFKMWCQVSRQETTEDKVTAFRTFVKARWKIDSIEWLPRSSVGKIKKTLEAMGAKHVG